MFEERGPCLSQNARALDYDDVAGQSWAWRGSRSEAQRDYVYGAPNACCHSGWVVRGQEYFSSMVEEFGFEPSIHHYGCNADLFAEAGKLDDAYAIVVNMKVELNIVVLTSLLAGRKTHKKI